MILWEQVKTTAWFYVSKESSLQGLTREELIEALDADPNLLPKIVCQGACLAGTRPYWRNRLMGLEAMARFLSPAASPVFVTFSCADMQWHDLQHHLPHFSDSCFSDYLTGNDQTWQWIVWDNIQDHPHVVAEFLDIQFCLFL